MSKELATQVLRSQTRSLVRLRLNCCLRAPRLLFQVAGAVTLNTCFAVYWYVICESYCRTRNPAVLFAFEWCCPNAYRWTGESDTNVQRAQVVELRLALSKTDALLTAAQDQIENLSSHVLKNGAPPSASP